jgi:hypothetical protein
MRCKWLECWSLQKRPIRQGIFILSTQFFNFGNDETFHFFKWVSEGGQVDRNAIIRFAYQKAEAHDDENFEDDDICIVVRDILHNHLDQMLNGFGDALGIGDWPGIGEVATMPNAPNGQAFDTLWRPLLALTFSRIDCRAVAEALLIQAGKWAPSKQRPEVL